MTAQVKSFSTEKRDATKNVKHHKFMLWFLTGLYMVLLSMLLPNSQGFSANAQMKQKTQRPIAKQPSTSVCPDVSTKKARCNARVITDQNGKPVSSTPPPPSAYTPKMLHSAYLLPCTPGGSVQAQCAQPTTFGPTIAIVDAYTDKTIQNDLTTFGSEFGLPACTTANGCLQIVNQTGGTRLSKTSNSSWSLETALDIETAHAICQTCKLLLVEANSATFQDLGTAENTAVKLGAVTISNSWGSSEFSGETGYDSYFSHPGIATFVAAGDNGYQSSYPSAVPDVISVGGTTLTLNTDDTYNSESVWSGTGSGCSLYESAPSYQLGISDWTTTGCGTNKAIADVAEDADPNTGVAVYDSTAYDGLKGWFQVGGTSLSTPLAAAIYAMSYVPLDKSIEQPGSLLYQNYSAVNFHDITQGSNGSCGTIMCNAAIGYDGPTGLGSLIGTGGF